MSREYIEGVHRGILCDSATVQVDGTDRRASVHPLGDARGFFVGVSREMEIIKQVCVFCGANLGALPIYETQAVVLGQELVRRNLGLVYGGGSIGLMGVIAQTVFDAGLPVLGIIPDALRSWELSRGTIGEQIVVQTMLERKELMAGRSDAFIALPGGFGTLDELFEMVTWGQLGAQRKSVGILNVNGYFDALLAWLDHAIDQGFVRQRHRGLIVVDENAAQLLDKMVAHEPPAGVVEWNRRTRPGHGPACRSTPGT